MTTAPYDLATLSDGGTPPPLRLDSAARVLQAALRIIENDRERVRYDTRIKQMIDGNPPYSTSLLKKHAQSWRSNVNPMFGKSLVSAAMVPYYDLLAGASHYAQVRLDIPDDAVRLEKSTIATEEFDAMLKEWPAFEFNLYQAMCDRLRYGKGFLTWSDENDLAFCWANRFNVHVPDRTKACVDYLELLVIEDPMAVDRLYDYVKDSKAASARGWNVDECYAAIKRASPLSASVDDAHPDREQAKRNDRDIMDGMSSAQVDAIHVYVKEFNGKVTHWIVERGAQDATYQASGNALFRKPAQYDDWSQCFWATFHEVTDGSWNGEAGIGKEIRAPIEIKTRVWNTSIDLTFLRSAMNVQAQSEGAFSKQPVIQMGPLNIYPPGLTPINVATFVGDLDSVIGMDRKLESDISRNIGIYRQSPEKAEGNPLTATGEMLRNQMSTVLSNSAITRFYSDLDRLYTELYRRAVAPVPKSIQSEHAAEFLRRCELRGVTASELREVYCVRAIRNIGAGSVIMRQQSLSQLASVAPLFPPSGQQEWMRDTVSALTDKETADRYLPLSPTGAITHDHQIAVLENDSLTHGSPAQINPDENHVIHAQSHLQVAGAGLASVQRGADPQTVLAALEGLMPHANAHIVLLERNPARKNEARMLRQTWDQIAQGADVLRKTAERIAQQSAKAAQLRAQAQAVAQGTDPQVQLDAAKLAADIRNKETRSAARMQQDREKHMHALALDDARQAAEIRRTTAQTVADIRNQTAKARADIERAKAAPARS